MSNDTMDPLKTCETRSEEWEPPKSRLRTVAVLSPVVGVIKEPVQLPDGDVLVGRGDASDVTIPEETVSRKHARVSRDGDSFIIYDLGSSNGTYVDGVPVVSCTLRDGDSIQIGKNLFFFDRLLELDDREEDAP